jgi:hypothetical protein
MKAALAKRPPRATTTKTDAAFISRAPAEPQARPESPRPTGAEVRNALLARAVLEARASPEPSFAWLLYHHPVTRRLCIRVLVGDECSHFPECRGRA